VELAIFDLDNTLLAGDSDHLWGQYLVAAGLVDGDTYHRENERFYQEYKDGILDIHEFLRFSLQPLRAYPRAALDIHRENFISEKILPIITPAARQLITLHREQGRFCLIITATNRFVTEPIAEALAVDELIATEPELKAGRFTGNISGIPCFQAGKVSRLEQWLRPRGWNLNESWFYSDSHNDLPLLEQVTHPVAVDPDETLESHAEFKGWPIITLRGKTVPPHGL